MSDRAVEDAIARGQLAAAVVIKHRDSLFAHIHMLLRAIGPIHTRACVAGAVEAAIIAYERGQVGDDAILDHCIDESVVVPFEGGGL